MTMNYTIEKSEPGILELASKLISDIHQSDVDEFLKIINPKMDGAKEIEKYNGLPLLQRGDQSNGYYFLTDKNKEHILYFVRYKMINVNGLKMGRQVLVWRSSGMKSSIESTGITQYVFFKKLLPRFDVLISDVEQTRYGKKFWEFALLETFNTPGLHAYYLDRRSTPNSLQELYQVKDVPTAQIWGEDEGHRRTHAVISNKPIKLRPI